MTAMPLVSCIMPTRNRRAFVAQSIWYFIRQDYSEKELIIVDDGADSVRDLIPNDSRIRYIPLNDRTSIGAKRNLACQEARGSLIAHWDDDDWMSSDRLSRQIAALHTSGADICGARELLHYHLVNGEAWVYRYPANGTCWLAGNSLLYRRSVWVECPFPDQNAGEDTVFVSQLPCNRVHAIADTSFIVAIIHGHNTGPKNPSGPTWEKKPLETVLEKLDFDTVFYAALRNGQFENRLARLRPASTSIAVAASFLVYDGYGSMAEYLVLGMARAGASVSVIPLHLDLTGMSAEFQEILKNSHTSKDSPVLYFSWPSPDLQRFHNVRELFINTMWESNQLPQGWREQLNRARMVIVPTRFVAQVCRDSGVTVPIEVIPEGVDPAVYHYEERPIRPSVTTLMVGTAIPRKHTREGIEAWKLAFGNDPEARLIIKARFKYGNYISEDPRICFVDTDEATRGIAHWYREADVLLALGSEGFGLPLIEGMATGLPVIALSSEGQSDTCEEARGLLLSVHPARWEEAAEAPFGHCGIRGVPGIEEVAEHLRWVANYQNEARALGRAASEWVLKNRNIWDKAPRVLDIMETGISGGKALVRSDTFWVPSWGTPCGLSEYVDHLTASIPGAQVSRQPMDINRMRVLHIQHEPSLFNETELLHQMQYVRQAGVPVIVTEHTVLPQADAWEREADVLVALTPRGTQTIQERWPSQRVEYLPHGCHTWFLPRKEERGKVIGVFGFLETYKGFWRLLDVLRSIPGAELLMFSYAKSLEMEELWLAASEGLPVRRVSQYLSVNQIACQLAAEADMLAFWYDEMPITAASGAVRIGLATGVPVLVSPTSWFQDVQHATFQPNELEDGVRRLLEDSELRQQLVETAQDYCHENSWKRVAERHITLWRSL